LFTYATIYFPGSPQGLINETTISRHRRFSFMSFLSLFFLYQNALCPSFAREIALATTTYPRQWRRDTMKEYQWDNLLDPHKELLEIKRVRQLQIRKRFKRNKLDPYRGELTSIYNAGGSFSDLVVWLRKQKRITVSRGSVHRIMSRWPEVQIRRRRGNA